MMAIPPSNNAESGAWLLLFELVSFFSKAAHLSCILT
jgi:hypothetical protein